jgi:hypothetical protein
LVNGASLDVLKLKSLIRTFESDLNSAFILKLRVDHSRCKCRVVGNPCTVRFLLLAYDQSDLDVARNLTGRVRMAQRNSTSLISISMPNSASQ